VPGRAALIFDVVGTVVDADATLRAEAGERAAELTARLDALTARGWRSMEALRREAYGDPRLATIGHRLRPFADAAEALRALAARHTVVALSNADLAELADTSAAGGLAWHAVLSAELVRAFKPDPAVYALALDRLRLDPAASVMVAAHPWDLRAAARHGLRTAYVARPGAERPAPDDRFDFHFADLAAIAAAADRDPGWWRRPD
jgi:HAD superfamily hydrolase (TIGR01493 family)